MRPILFNIGSIPIKSWGVFVAAGFLTGLYFAIRRAKEKNINPEIIYDFAFYLLISGVIGARLAYVLGHLDIYLKNPLQIIYVNNGGMAVFGSITSGFIVALIFVKHYKISLLELGDVIAPSLLVGQAIGRIGCYLNACCYGSLAKLSWAVKFPLIEGYRHPTQLYEAILDITVFGFLWHFRKKFKTKGMMFLSGALAYSSIRFIVELFRVSSGRVLWLSISLIIVVASLLSMALIKKKSVDN